MTDAADLVPFSTWLGLRRRGLGLTQAQLASRVACSTVTIRKIENGDLKPGVDLVTLLAGEFSVPGETRAAFIEFARNDRINQLPGAFREKPASQRAAAGPRMPPLPASPSSLVGRDAELAHALSLARAPDVRMVTFTGAPGVGKSRLCLEVARALEPEFANGAAFVRLDSLNSAAQVLPAIATALGLHGDTPNTADALAAWLQRRSVLLVIDNFEHVIEAAGELRRMLEHARNCKALLTSRIALRVYGEHDFVVPPLPIRDETGGAGSAMRLYVQRAQSARFGFAPDGAALSAIEEICSAVDGLPLAIEMAASAVRSATPQVVLAQLRRSSSNFGALRRDAHARQLSLRAMLDWSYGLLTPQCQRVLRATAIFAGEFTAQAMHAVLRGDGDAAAVQTALAELVDHGLLKQNALDAWFMPLAVVRDYAANQLLRQGEQEDTQAAHAVWCKAICNQQRSLKRVMVTVPEWVAFGRCMPDIERVIERLLAGGDPASALAMLIPVLRWAEMRDRLGLYGPLLERALAGAPDHPDAALGRMWLALVHTMHGDRQRAPGLFDAAYLKPAGGGDARERYEFLLNAALVQLRLIGWQAAAPIVDAAIAHVQRANMAHEHSILQRLQALIARDSGNHALGAQLINRQLAEMRANGDVAELGLALYTAATCELGLGNLAAARAAAEEALTLELAHGADRRIVQTLEVLAWIGARDRDAAMAARRLGSALAYRERSKVNLSQRQLQWREEAVAHVREALGDAGFAAAHAAGQQLTDAEVIREAA